MQKKKLNVLKLNIKIYIIKIWSKKLKELNEELNKKLNLLKSESEIEYYNSLKYDYYNIYTHCDICKINCHNPCDCLGSSLGRYFRFSSGLISH